MFKSKAKYGAVVLAGLLAPVLPALSAPRSPSAASLRGSVIKLNVSVQRWNYAVPWQSFPPSGGSGTGFYIGKKRILTNAHIISDARFLLVQKDGDPTRYPAKVSFVAHDCDLATLTVDDERFFKGMQPMAFANRIPELDEQVTVLGYPLGGARLSITRGVVSRIDYNTYSHSAVDQHLVLQVDAAINPGNSGGPVLIGNQVVGLAFQGLARAENIGYAIPLPVIRHFLDDISDGVYHGYPELGVAYLELSNKALQEDLAVPKGHAGVVVYYVDPFGSANGVLKPGDVLLSIDGQNIAHDGTIRLNGDVVIFPEILERKQWGEAVELVVWRDRSKQKLNVPLTNPADPFLYRNLYDVKPRYYIHGGLVFCPLTRPYLQSVRRRSGDVAVEQLTYYMLYAKSDGHHVDRDEFVVLVGRLPHPVNTYADGYMNRLVKEVNGVAVGSLDDVKRAFEDHEQAFHVVTFEGMSDTLVLDAPAADTAGPRILEAYGVPAAENLTGH
jgi:S1-C subfamily serine protease